MFIKWKISDNSQAYSILAVFFLGVFSYFYWIGDYVLFFQEKQSLFVYTREYLHGFTIMPGGLLEYAGKFLTQFYSNAFAGSIILALVLTLPALVLFRINKRLQAGSPFSLFLMLIPSALLLLMQTRYYHSMEYNLGYILVLIYFLVAIIPEIKILRYLGLCFFPLFLYLSGAFAWIFLGIYGFYMLVYGKGINKIVYSAVLLVIAGLTLVVFKNFIFLQPYGQIILFPFPFINDPAHTLFFRISGPVIVMYPVLYKTAGLIRVRIINNRIYNVISVALLFAVVILGLKKLYNPQTARVIQIEELVFRSDWKKVIELQEKDPSYNMIGQYFYNIALSETGQLCDRLFHGSQDFGSGSLILPWSNEHLSWGAYFFYSIGLVNEAHRWAYEEMVVYGYRPQNIKLLIRTSIINGNYRMAEKYIGILKRTLFYRAEASRYESLLANPANRESDPDIFEKSRIRPRENFFIQLDTPESNLALMLSDNPQNRKAFEYLMAWLLLNKDVETVVSNIQSMKGMDYTRIPVHLEEAVLIYYNSKKVIPDLAGLSLSPETIMRFDQYVQSYLSIRQNPAAGREMMRQKYGNTFWYYFHFK